MDIPEWAKNILDWIVLILFAISLLGILTVLIMIVRGQSSVGEVVVVQKEGFLGRAREIIRTRDLFALLLWLKDGFFRLWIVYVLILLLLIAYAIIRFI